MVLPDQKCQTEARNPSVGNAPCPSVDCGQKLFCLSASITATTAPGSKNESDAQEVGGSAKL